MNVNCFELDASKNSKNLKVVDLEQAAARWLEGEGTFWIDLDSYGREELEPQLVRLQLPSFVVDRCLNVGEATQTIPLPDAVFFELAVYADPACSRLASVGVLCLNRLLITLHPEPIHTLEKTRKDIDEFHMAGNTTSHLLSALLLLKIDEAAREARRIRSALGDIDERMDHDADSVSLEEILDAKQAVSRLVTVSEEQEEGFDVLAEAQTNVLDFSELGGPVKLLTSTAGAVNRRADRLATRVSDVRQRYEMRQQDRTNHRLAILTVISAVFLPLTLIAGIWGMNFSMMPELGMPYGYFLGLGLMVLTAAVLTWSFHKRGWFD